MDGDQDCALRCAADQGHDLVVDLLLRAGAGVHAMREKALAAAAEKGYITIVKQLLQAGADVTCDGQRAIQSAARGPNIEVLQCVLHALGDVPVDGRALSNALHSYRPDHLQLLLDWGADPNWQDGQALRTLAMVLSRRSPATVAMLDMLIKAGADVHARDDDALRTVIQNGCAESVQRLLQHGASLQAVCDNPGPELSAIAWNGDVPMLELLLDAGMPLNGAASAEILIVAGRSKRLEVIELFERRGASPVSTDSARLLNATKCGDLQLVHALLTRELDPGLLHGEAVRTAVEHRFEPVVAALLEHGQRVGPAPPELRMVREGCLVHAANLDSMGIFRLLVDHIVLDASEFVSLLVMLLDRAEVCAPAVKYLLDRYAGTLLSVAELRQVSNHLPRGGPGREALRPYLALKHKRGS